MRSLALLALLSACSFEGGGATIDPADGGEDASAPDAVSADAGPDATVPTCVDLPSGALAWWDGEAIGIDVLGQFSVHSVFETPTIELGLVGNAMDLDDQDDIIINPAPQAPMFTVETWIRREANDLNFMTIYGRDNASSLRLLNHQLVYRESEVIVASVGEIPLDIYTHVAATYDGVTIRLYIDAVQDGVATAAAGLPQPGRIGGIIGAGGLDFIGKVDELTVYDRPLTPAEIKSIFDAGELGKCLPAN